MPKNNGYTPTPREFLMGFAWSLWLNNIVMLVFLALQGFDLFYIRTSIFMTWIICNALLLIVPAICMTFSRKEDSSSDNMGNSDLS